eukprot:scaffold2306_cov179-Alexandrium_tamarense.AAC.22
MERRSDCRCALATLLAIPYLCYLAFVTQQLRPFDVDGSSSSVSSSTRVHHRRLEKTRERHLHQWIEPPSPLITGRVWNATSIQWIGNSFYFPSDDTNTSPTSFKLYTPHQIQKALRLHSVLIQGDSTCRRFYGTLHGLLNFDIFIGSINEENVKGFPNNVPSPPFGIPATYYARRGLDFNVEHDASRRDVSQISLALNSPSFIDPRHLDHRTIIDVNKEFYTEPCQRSFPSDYLMNVPSFDNDPNNADINFEGVATDITERQSLSLFKKTQFEYKVCRSHPTGSWLPPLPILPKDHTHQYTEQKLSLPKHFPPRYDYVMSNCIGHIYDFVNNELLHNQSVTQRYSLYVVSPGVWETVKRAACHHPVYETIQSSNGSKLEWPETVYNLLQSTLEKLSQLAELSPKFVVVWRTSGYYDGDTMGYAIEEINRRSVEFITKWNENFANKEKLDDSPLRRNNFLLMDWGSAMKSRSHGKDRLRGDMQAHYGLEARILQAQMLVNLLYEHGYVNG